MRKVRKHYLDYIFDPETRPRLNWRVKHHFVRIMVPILGMHLSKRLFPKRVHVLVRLPALHERICKWIAVNIGYVEASEVYPRLIHVIDLPYMERQRYHIGVKTAVPKRKTPDDS